MNLPIKRRRFFKWSLGLGLGAWLGRPASAQRFTPFVDMAVTPDGRGLWALDLMGHVASIGDAPVFIDPPDARPGFVALGASPSGGLYALSQDGNLRTFGRGAPSFDMSAARAHHIPFVDMAIAPSGEGLWALDLMGKVLSFGAAPAFTDPPDGRPIFQNPPDTRPSPYVALVPTPSGGGLFALTLHGAIRTFGAARVFTDPPDDGSRLPFVDLAITPRGDGLWDLDLRGRVRTFGAPPVFTDQPDTRPSPFVALAPTPSGGGLYCLTMNGQLRTFGDARNFTPRTPV